MVRFAMLFALCCAPIGAAAQTAHPYAGMQTRAIKALSPPQIDDLRAGRGMGLALAAELNGYPGPLHVIELADRLGLSQTQRERAQALFAAMKAETIPLGETLIAQESELDRLFASRTVTPASLSDATQQIGATQGALRAAHLKYHLSTLEMLTPQQVASYTQLRGYGSQTPSHPHHGGHRN